MLPSKKRVSTAAMDRISELPQPIFHHILTFLSQKESVQTCLLSKSWRYLGSTRPKLEFSERSIPWPSFLNIADKTLQRYEDQNLSMHEFILEVSGNRSGIVPFLEKWISIVVSLGGLKRLYLNFGISKSYLRVVAGCDLPQVLFQAESIQELFLAGCKITSAEKVMFKNLQTLGLSDVEIGEETFEKIMSSCPLIEGLGISGCPGLRTVKVKNAQNLKIFDCVVHSSGPVLQRESHIEKDSRIEIVAPTTLQSIYIGSCHDNNVFPNLKSLCLDTVRLSTESFGDPLS